MTGSALVLGGGGVTGIAWEIGLLAGLLELGVDLTTADLIVGTSAGSVVGALVATGGDLEEFYRRQLEPSGSELAPFDADSGVPLVDAVAASCAVPGVWPPMTVNGRQYIDGGVRSTANVDLASGCDRIVVLAPIPRGGGPMPGVSSQVARLGDSARVAVVTPNQAARAAFGRNVLDPARRAPSARAGRAQAADAAIAVHSVWSEI